MLPYDARTAGSQAAAAAAAAAVAKPLIYEWINRRLRPAASFLRQTTSSDIPPTPEQAALIGRSCRTVEPLN